MTRRLLFGYLAITLMVLGVLTGWAMTSLMLWALILIVTVKYVIFLMRADNDGEGGVLALLALAQRGTARRGGMVLAFGAIGAALVMLPRWGRFAAPLTAFLVVIAGNMDGPYRLINDGREAWDAGWWQGMGWNASRVVYDGTIQTISNPSTGSVIPIITKADRKSVV